MKCNCTKIQKELYRYDREELSIEYIEHIKICPVCAATEQKVTQLRGIVRLKSYEKPDPEVLRCCMAEVHHRLVTWENDVRHGQSAVDGYPQFGWRYGVAAVLLCLVALNGFIASQLPTLESGVMPNNQAVSADTLIFASTNRQDTLVPFSPQLSTNRSASGRSVLTTFE